MALTTLEIDAVASMAIAKIEAAAFASKTHDTEYLTVHDPSELASRFSADTQSMLSKVNQFLAISL